MGACSSKPKTTEFEGYMEPLRKTEDVNADRSIDAHVDSAQVSERSLQTLTDEPGKEIPVISEEVGANASADVVQEKLELTSVVEEPPKLDLSSTAEGDGVAQKDGVDDKEEANDKASPVGEDVGGLSVDGDNVCEDKAIVLNEVGDGVIDNGDVYTDKAVALDEEKAHESLDMGCVSTHNNGSSKAQDITASAGVESPIIGVVKPVEPIHVDDVSESVGMAIADTTVADNFTPPVAAEKVIDSLAEIGKEVSTGTSDIVAVQEEGNDLLSDLPRRAENAKASESTVDDALPAEDEDLQEGCKVSPHVSEDEVGQENAANVASGVDPLPESAESRDEICVKGPLEDTAKSDITTEPQMEVEECASEHPQGEITFDARSMGESHVKVKETEGNAPTLGELKVCAPKSLEETDAESPVIPKVEATPEEVVKEKVEATPGLILDEPSAHPQDLAVEGGKLEGMSAIAEPSAEIEKVEQFQAVEATTAAKDKVESTDTQISESSAERVKSALGEGELAFEDASDVPLKVESSKAESGQALRS